MSGFTIINGVLGASSLAGSMTMTRREMPICGAASPMPGASYMVASMSSISLRSSSSTRSTGLACLRKIESGMVRMRRMAM